RLELVAVGIHPSIRTPCRLFPLLLRWQPDHPVFPYAVGPCLARQFCGQPAAKRHRIIVRYIIARMIPELKSLFPWPFLLLCQPLLVQSLPPSHFLVAVLILKKRLVLPVSHWILRYIERGQELFFTILVDKFAPWHFTPGN